MTLADLKRLAIKKQLKVHFRLRNGLECIVTEEGVASIPELRAIPDFNLEEELAAAGDFLIEAPPPAQTRKATRTEITALAADSPAAGVPHDHDDE